jgi:hypothetical protein
MSARSRALEDTLCLGYRDAVRERCGALCVRSATRLRAPDRSRGHKSRTRGSFGTTIEPFPVENLPAVDQDDSLLVALPYGERTDWLKNVLASGSAAVVTNGRTYDVDQDEVIPIAEATNFFRPREQGMHRHFHVDSALRLRRT